jgi:hypothetical protein
MFGAINVKASDDRARTEGLRHTEPMGEGIEPYQRGSYSTFALDFMPVEYALIGGILNHNVPQVEFDVTSCHSSIFILCFDLHATS